MDDGGRHGARIFFGEGQVGKIEFFIFLYAQNVNICDELSNFFDLKIFHFK